MSRSYNRGASVGREMNRSYYRGARVGRALDIEELRQMPHRRLPGFVLE
ncbi:MAG: hypothetical protein JWP01_1832 [Myxococcales bacterium]|nr:hypothetical protein [Myxococcales bacterium]